MRRQATRCPEHDNCTVLVPLDDEGHQLWSEAEHSSLTGTAAGEGFNLPPAPIHESAPSPGATIIVQPSPPHVELAGPSARLAVVCSIGSFVVAVAALVVALVR